MSLAAASAAAGDFSRHVDPFIGTGVMEGGLCGNNYPGATMPFGMVQLCPDTHPTPDWFNASGYQYTDNHIYGFSHTRLSGTGASDLIDILLFPSTGNATSSTFSHDDEEAAPGYYKVKLADEDIIAEMTATTRVGIHRYTYPRNSRRNILLDLDHSAQKGSWDRKIIQSQIRQTSPTTIEGYRVITGWAKLRKIYFVAEFSSPIVNLSITDGGQPRGNATVVNGRDLKAWIDFGQGRDRITAKVALSGVSCDNARLNMAAEAPGWKFKDYIAAADAAWDRELSRIEVDGGTPEQLKIFYTGLYHVMIQPNTFSDVNGQYMTPVYTVGQLPDGATQYTTFSLWDTYRAAHPLYTLITPSRNADFVNSMLRHYDDYG